LIEEIQGIRRAAEIGPSNAIAEQPHPLSNEPGSAPLIA